MNNKCLSCEGQIVKDNRCADCLQKIEDCSSCQDNKGKMYPSHFASSRCESGKRNHCTCDTCF